MDILYAYESIQSVVEIVKDRFYFAVVSSEKENEIKNKDDLVFFRSDKEYIYNNFYNDFGPLNISCLYKYCHKVNEYLKKYALKRLVHFTPDNIYKKTNAAFLIGCYSVLYIDMNPKDMYKAFMSSNTQFKPFLDASQGGGSQWTITLLDCYNAILKARILGFFDFRDFNPNEYDKYDRLLNGDINWLLPRKFLAFIGPMEESIALASGYHSPKFYVSYFFKHGVRSVIRLNASNTYDARIFRNSGIEHHDLFFPDGSTPPKHILTRFLNISESTQGAIAVHCKAGLGRTGSLIGAYIIKHFHMTAREAIAWMRICRPGSVIGQQQGWLERIEPWLWRQGAQYRIASLGAADRLPHFRYGIYSHEAQHSKYDTDPVNFKDRTINDSPRKRIKQLAYTTQGDELNIIKLKHSGGAPNEGKMSPRNLVNYSK